MSNLISHHSFNKAAGYLGEQLVQTDYESRGFCLIDKNFTIRGGELDLIMETTGYLVFIEVKVVNYVDSLHDYITKHKLQALQRSIQTYLWRFPTTKSIRLDIVFVKGDEIIYRVEGVDM